MAEEIVDINYNNLTYEFLNTNKQSVIKVIKDEVDFYFKLSLISDSKKFIVFSNGAVDRGRKKAPYFQRSSWVDDYNANCIFVDDRTLHNNELRVGFGIGNTSRHYLLDISKILLKIRGLWSTSSSKTIYFGSSAGGFLSLAYATLDKDSLAIVNNARIYVNKTYSYNLIKKTLFPGIDNKTILKNYGDRVSIIAFMKKHKNVPNAIHYVNRLSKSDHDIHYKLYFANTEKYRIRLSNQNFVMYSNYSKKHDTLSRSDTSQIINSALNQELPLINKSKEVL